MDPKNMFTFFYPVLDSLSRGGLLRNVMANLFRLIGILIFGFSLYYFFKNISYAPDFWFVVLMLLFVAACYISLQIFFYRGKKILELEDSDFTVIPIISQLLRAAGEFYAVFIIAIGLGGTLMLWFSSNSYSLYDLARYIPGVGFDDTFLGGLLFLVLVIVIAFLILLLAYFIAENILVLVEIAKNTRPLRKDHHEEKPSGETGV